MSDGEPRRVLVALGGNAMTGPGGEADPGSQLAAVEVAMASVAEVIARGHEVVLTHGNGPQVGNILVKNELARDVVPPVPLDWCGAQTQATIGFMIMNSLEHSLRRLGIERMVATLVTRVMVDADDPAWTSPSKPVGRYVGDGAIVVAAGGGGIPVVRRDGRLSGVEAVLDKDLTGALLATAVQAEIFVIATDVEHAAIDYGTPDERAIEATSPGELRALAAEGHFAGGSMGPKVEAACRFVEAGGRRSAITSLGKVAEAVDGGAGTVVETR
jgi:carbamate kinase